MSATLALLHRHAGIREGVYTHVSAPDWRTIGTQRFRIRAEVFDSGRIRGRTWHWLEDEQLRPPTLVRERRTSRDPADAAPPVA